MRYPVIILALLLALGFMSFTSGTSSAQEPPFDPPPPLEPWASIIIASGNFDCFTQADIGYSNIVNGQSECKAGNLESCETEGLQGNSDCRGRAQAVTVYALSGEQYDLSYRSAAWDLYNQTVCLSEAYANADANPHTAGFSGGEEEFYGLHGHLCPSFFGAQGASDEARARWQHDADHPHDATEIGDPNKCELRSLCGSSGDTNPLNAGFVCADGSLPKAVPLNGEDWTCEEGVELLVVQDILPPAAGTGWLSEDKPYTMMAAFLLFTVGLGALTAVWRKA